VHFATNGREEQMRPWDLSPGSRSPGSAASEGSEHPGTSSSGSNPRRCMRSRRLLTISCHPNVTLSGVDWPVLRPAAIGWAERTVSYQCARNCGCLYGHRGVTKSPFNQ